MGYGELLPQATLSLDGEHLNGTPLESIAFSPIPAVPVPDASFVDGGSAILFRTPARAIGVIKLCCVTTRGMQREHIRLATHLVSITASDGRFVVRSQPMQGSSTDVEAIISRDWTREELSLPDDAAPETLLDPLRMLAEHAFCPDGVTILDGSVRTLARITTPRQHLATLAKTTSLLTSCGRPACVALSQRAPAGTWQAEIMDGCRCLRLHAAATHTFLLEGDASESTLSLLHAWSADAAFPGYPYPLVLADQLARVTHQEQEMLRATLAADRTIAGQLLAEARSTDAHDMLEHILYGKEML